MPGKQEGRPPHKIHHTKQSLVNKIYIDAQIIIF